MTDLCATCQGNNTAIIRSSNVSEDETKEKLADQEGHLMLATKQRSHYQAQVHDAKMDLEGQRLDDDDKTSPPQLPTTPLISPNKFTTPITPSSLA